MTHECTTCMLLEQEINSLHEEIFRLKDKIDDLNSQLYDRGRYEGP